MWVVPVHASNLLRLHLQGVSVPSPTTHTCFGREELVVKGGTCLHRNGRQQAFVRIKPSLMVLRTWWVRDMWNSCITL